MTIYALTLTYNGKNHLEKLYPTLKLAANRLNQKLYWYIRDNNSTDGTEEYIVPKQEDFIKYYKVDHNRDNYAKGNNFLVEKIKEEFDTKNDYYLLLNNDIIINDPNSIVNMLRILETDQDVGIVGAKLFYTGTKTIQHFGVAISPKHANMPWHVYNGEDDNEMTRYNKLFQAVTGACLLIRCSCFDLLDGGKMNEGFSWAFDDVDLSLQVNINQHKKIVCCAKVNISHSESATLAKNPVNKLFLSNNVNLFRKNWGGKCKVDYFDYINNSDYNRY